MSHSLVILQDQLDWLVSRQREAMDELVRANTQLVRAQTDVKDIERDMDERDETIKDIKIGIETLEKYGA